MTSVSIKMTNANKMSLFDFLAPSYFYANAKYFISGSLWMSLLPLAHNGLIS